MRGRWRRCAQRPLPSMMTATWRGMRERSSWRSSSDSSTLKGPRVFGAPIVDGESCLVCGTATVARFLGDFPLPRKVNIRIVGMQTMCRESIGHYSHDDQKRQRIRPIAHKDEQSRSYSSRCKKNPTREFMVWGGGSSSIKELQETSRQYLRTEILDVGIGSESRVIREIPARVIWIVVQHDVVGVPQPIAGVVVVVWRDAPVKTAEPETVPASAFEAI